MQKNFYRRSGKIISVFSDIVLDSYMHMLVIKILLVLMCFNFFFVVNNYSWHIFSSLYHIDECLGQMFCNEYVIVGLFLVVFRIDCEYIEAEMLPSSHKQTNGTALLGRQTAGAQIDRIGTLLLEKKSLERKRPGSEQVYDDNDSVIRSKRSRTVKETLFNLLPVLSAQNNCKNVRNESNPIPLDRIRNCSFGQVGIILLNLLVLWYTY